jgi:hypothetical protein
MELKDFESPDVNKQAHAIIRALQAVSSGEPISDNVKLLVKEVIHI